MTIPRERLRREDPARTGPIRNWSTLYRRSDSWDFPQAPGQPASDGDGSKSSSPSDVVRHGVELGYRVIEEQIRQGQRIAEQLNHRAYDSRAMGSDLREVADRAWRYYADLGALWVDFLASIAGDGELVRKLFTAWRPAEAAAAPTSSNGAVAVSVEVASVRPAKVTLDLRPHSEGLALVCRALHDVDAAKPPLTDVAFAPASGALGLSVRVPEGQPAGVYVGAVVDVATQEPRGTLTVRLA
jgi:hypothetical protein